MNVLKNKTAIPVAALLLLAAVLLISFRHEAVRGLGPQALKAAEETDNPEARPLASLADLNRAFVDLAKIVNPKVVTVFTEKVYRVDPRYGSPFEDFFGNFFGQRYRQEPQAEPREFRQNGLGSGVIVSDDGIILTNNHVVQDADSINVRLMDDKILPAKVVGADPQTDIAVLKVEGLKAEPIVMGDSDRLEVGEWVLAVGSPLSPNLAHTVTSGIVSAKGRSNVGLAEYEDFIQTDAAINPGNSGGALINMRGELVGINTAIASRSGGNMGIGFAVPVNMARHVMESIISEGKVVRGWLGVYIQDVDENLATAMKLEGTAGALISDVVKDGPAGEAGLESGDLIVKLDGREIAGATELRNNVAAKAPGAKIALEVLREGDKREFKVTLGELKPDAIAGAQAQDWKALLGFTAASLDRERAGNYGIDPSAAGVLVESVEQGSAAEGAGLREGDLIVSVNRSGVRDMADFSERIQPLKRGDNLFLRLVRGQRVFFLAYTL